MTSPSSCVCRAGRNPEGRVWQSDWWWWGGEVRDWLSRASLLHLPRPEVTFLRPKRRAVVQDPSAQGPRQVEEHKACTKGSDADISERSRRWPPTGVFGRAIIGHCFHGSVQARCPSTVTSSTVPGPLHALSRLAGTIWGAGVLLSERPGWVDCWARVERWFHPEQVRGQHQKWKDANVEEEGVR